MSYESNQGRKLLFSRLEFILGKRVKNNSNWIRYPISFPDNTELRGRSRLNTMNLEWDELLEGRYKFGANELFVFHAIDEILEDLQRMLPPGAIEDVCKQLYERQRGGYKSEAGNRLRKVMMSKNQVVDQIKEFLLATNASQDSIDEKPANEIQQITCYYLSRVRYLLGAGLMELHY